MTDLTHDQKMDHVEKIYKAISETNRGLDVKDTIFSIKIAEMNGSIYLTDANEEIEIYCSPAVDQFFADEQFENDDTVKISFDVPNYAGLSLYRKDVKIQLTWKSVKEDVDIYMAALITFLPSIIKEVSQ